MVISVSAVCPTLILAGILWKVYGTPRHGRMTERRKIP